MRLLALDQALHITGYAIFVNEKLEAHGKIITEDKDTGRRLTKIRESINQLIDKYQIDYIVYEDIQLQNNTINNVNTFKTLAEVFGVVSELASNRKISHQSVYSSSWKSTLGIKGKTRPEQKKNALEYVMNNYKIQPTQDEADAICLGTHLIYKKSLEYDWSD